ncbi:cyclin-related 2, partial [Sistotremastrum niveocremeum HHB9708]
KTTPLISIRDYLSRICKYCPNTPNDVYVSILVHFDRIARRSSYLHGAPFRFDSSNIHRLILATVTTSSKYYADLFYSHTRYAKVGGIELAELSHLEMEFLCMIDFDMKIPTTLLRIYASAI